MQKTERGEKEKIFVKGIIIGYKRGLRQQKISDVRIKIPKIKHEKECKFFLGKKLFLSLKKPSEKKRKVIYGKIKKLHGRSGVFLARFKKNLPPNSFNMNVRISGIHE
jgi:large subunit ribosomal protein L35Ae